MNYANGLMPACSFEALLQIEERCLICKGEFNWLVMRESDLRHLISLYLFPFVPGIQFLPFCSYVRAGLFMFQHPALNEIPSLPFLTFLTHSSPQAITEGTYKIQRFCDFNKKPCNLFLKHRSALEKSVFLHWQFPIMWLV